MRSYQLHRRQTISSAVHAAVSAATSVRDEIITNVRELHELRLGAPAGGALADGLRDDIHGELDRLRGLDLEAALALEEEILATDSGDPADWPAWTDDDTWETDGPAGGTDLGMADPADTDADAPSDRTCPTARALATRHASGTIAELSVGCIYADDRGTLFCQPHPSGREEDDLPDRVRIGEMTWDHDEGRWIAEPRHEGHDLDAATWAVVEDVARDWSRQF